MRGYTLAETLVAAALSLLVLLFTGSALVMAMRAWAQAQRMETAQRGTLTLAYRLRHDYMTVLPSSVRYDAGILSMLSDDQRDWSDAGEPLYHHWTQYRYLATEKTVERREFRINPPISSATGLPPGWPAASKGVLLAERVTLFDPVLTTGSGLLRLRLRAQDETSASRMDLDILPQIYAQDGR
ncbi:MAG: hypothetical protein J0I12_05835 [Candidatus Eremiobacteraeota bacterium]|nr:hypothetical protein [Candidatus Eremiobacteraeota bacterium]